jgi:hypothetical protein
MAKRSPAKTFNTVASLFIVFGAILVGYYVFKNAGKAGSAIAHIVPSFGGGGAGTIAPVGGGQFGPGTTPVPNPADVSREVTPNFSPVTTAGGVVTTGAFADVWNGLFKTRFGAPSVEQASTFPTAAPPSGMKPPTYVADATGVSITGGGRVPLGAIFLGYAPGTNTPMWGR